MNRKTYRILKYIHKPLPKPSPKHTIKDINKGGIRVKYTNKTAPPPPPQPNCNLKYNINLIDKIKRIENYLKQLEYERHIKKSLGEEKDIILTGKMIGLNIALSILKDEI